MADTGSIDPSSNPDPVLWHKAMNQAGIGQPESSGPAKASSDVPGLGSTMPVFVAPNPAAPVMALVPEQALLVMLDGLAALGATAQRRGGPQHQPALCGDRP